MSRKTIYRLISIPLFLIVAIFIICKILWGASYVIGDYPGPAILKNVTAQKTGKIDWLLIHGASVDARVWDAFINSHCDDSLVAISLGDQQYGSAQAQPGVMAGQQLTNFLQNFAIQKGIITHSTGSLWLAQAYHQCPQCLQHLKIILLAPNAGDNALGVSSGIRSTLKWGSIFAPDPYLNVPLTFELTPIQACEGGNSYYYATCRSYYMCGTHMSFTSINYYRKLVKYMSDFTQQKYFIDFLKNDAKNITIYIPGDDKILQYQNIIPLAQQDGIPIVTIPNISHVGLLVLSQDWFADDKQACVR